MTNKVEINKTIKLDSGKIGSDIDEMYITDDYLLFGSTRVKFSNINDINQIRNNKRDYMSYSIILSNIISSLVLGFTLTQNILVLLAFSLIGFFIGYIIVRIAKNEAAMYISIVTDETEYEFGISTILDAGEFFITIDDKTNINLSYENFLLGEKSEYQQEHT